MAGIPWPHEWTFRASCALRRSIRAKTTNSHWLRATPMPWPRVLRKVPIMLRYILAPLAAVVLFTACLIPDDAEARRGGVGYRGGGGYRGGAVAVRGPRGGGAVAVRGGGYRNYGYRGGYRGYGYRGYGVGAAAVGAAAVGAAAYRRSCYDPYGNWICAY